MELIARLDAEQVAALEQRIVERVLESVAAKPVERLLTVSELADMLGTSEEWCRRNQAHLGAFKLTDGAGRAPIRFRLRDVEAYLTTRRLRPPVTLGANGGWRSDPDWSVR